MIQEFDQLLKKVDALSKRVEALEQGMKFVSCTACDGTGGFRAINTSGSDYHPCPICVGTGITLQQKETIENG